MRGNFGEVLIKLYCLLITLDCFMCKSSDVSFDLVLEPLHSPQNPLPSSSLLPHPHTVPHLTLTAMIAGLFWVWIWGAGTTAVNYS